MKRKWTFWLIRMLIYMGIAALLIWQYQENKADTSIQNKIMVVGEIFGAVILFIELFLVVRRAMKRKAE